MGGILSVADPLHWWSPVAGTVAKYMVCQSRIIVDTDTSVGKTIHLATVPATEDLQWVSNIHGTAITPCRRLLLWTVHRDLFPCRYLPRPGGRPQSAASGLFIALVIQIPAVSALVKTSQNASTVREVESLPDCQNAFCI